MNNIIDYLKATKMSQEILEDDWLRCVEKYEKIWGEVADDLLDVDVLFSDNLGSTKSAFGVTQKLKCEGLRVLFWSALTEVYDEDVKERNITDIQYWEILLHEMCHCAAYFTDGSLDHGKTWQHFVTKLNKSCAYNITETSNL